MVFNDGVFAVFVQFNVRLSYQPTLQNEADVRGPLKPPETSMSLKNRHANKTILLKKL